MRHLTTILLTAIALAAPAAADASAPSRATTLAMRVAAATFGTPCGGSPVSITWGDTHRFAGDGQHGGWAGWTGADGRPQGDGPTNLRTRCAIRIDGTFARRARRYDWHEWALYCSVIAHEVGHLTGHEHSENPWDVMAPDLQVSAPQCTRAAKRYGYDWT